MWISSHNLTRNLLSTNKSSILCLLDSAQENQLDAMGENDEDFEVLELEFTDEEKEVMEERDEW